MLCKQIMVRPVYQENMNFTGPRMSMGQGDADETDALPVNGAENRLNNQDRSRVSGIGAAVCRAFIQNEFRRQNIPEPVEIIGSVSQSHQNGVLAYEAEIARVERQLCLLSEEFSRSPLRQWVSDQAGRVPLQALEFDSFSDLLYGLFQEGGVTWERIIILFYFCTDLSIRAYRENQNQQLRDIIDWTFRFMTGERMLRWINDHGGWVKVIEKPVFERYHHHLVKILFVGIITLAVLLWRGR